MSRLKEEIREEVQVAKPASLSVGVGLARLYNLKQATVLQNKSTLMEY